MRLGLQFGAGLCGLGLSAVLFAPCVMAQDHPSNEQPPARQQQPQPREANRTPRNDRPASSYHPQGPSRGENRDDRRRTNENDSRGNQNSRANDSRGDSRNDRPQNQYRQQDRQPAPAIPPPNVQERLRNMSPQDRQRLAQNEQRLRSLSPAQQQELRDRARVWQRMTPEQREHIRNDVLPKWRQLPPQRQKAIQQRLGVLQNMPEAARNRHLNDPNFTRGMSQEDKQLLRDLSHQHVGGASEQAQEQ
jgi:hypothetical protein